MSPLGRRSYTVREGAIDGPVVADAYKHAGPEEPINGTRIVIDATDWRVTFFVKYDSTGAAQDTLVVDPF